MTPADELGAAAAKLRETARPLIATDEQFGWSEFFTDHGADLGLWQEGERWIALASPAFAEPLAAWLEAVADGWEKSTSLFPAGADTRFAGHPALAVARALLGGEQP